MESAPISTITRTPTTTTSAKPFSPAQAADTPSSDPSQPPTSVNNNGSNNPVVRPETGDLSGSRVRSSPGAGTSPGTGRKIERSCHLCHRRKVRCDKKLPCASCIRGGFQCYYPPVGQPVRRVRKTTIADVANRISDLEKSLVAGAVDQHHAAFRTPSAPGSVSDFASNHHHQQQQQHQQQHHQNPPASAPRSGIAPPPESHGKVAGDEILVRKGTSTQYFDEVLISRVIEEEHDIQSVLSTPGSEPAPQAAPSPFNPMGILSTPDPKLHLADLLPPKSGAVELWRNYVDNIEVCNKVLHRPTAEILVYTAIDDPHNAPVEAMAIIFSVFFMSVITLEPATVQSLTGEDKTTNLHRFKTGLEQAFAKADFLEHPSVRLLEALAIYLAALRIHNPGRGLWTLNGLAIRAAQSIGLHRDGTKLGLTTFESEIRRRIWWHLLGRDGRAGEDYGIQNSTGFSLHAGVSYPSNLDDGDLYPEMRELPPPRPGWTQLTIVLINIQSGRTWHRLATMASSWAERPTPESVRAQIVRELHDYAEGFLRNCNPVIPQQRQTMLVARFIIRKLDLVTRQQWLHLEHPEARESFATEENLQEALGILEAGMNLASDELLRPYRWSMRAYPPYHMLLYVLWHLCVKPEGPSVDKAWRAVDEHSALIRQVSSGSGPAAKMTILDALRAKALAVHQRLAQQNEGDGEGAGDAVGDVEAAGNADKEAYPTPRAEDRPDADGQDPSLYGSAGAEGMDWSSMMQDFPDWGTLMNEFQVDGLDFPNYLN
ncbi:Bikaverin cluster transcription factor bik5 [Colletotrichum higginsianum]|uniref:Bikaverin cluster transcription factor bik5 n=1 Tax=Colletotrichum higginsianum TaxID=80884 RepID=A0A4V4NA81_9PEZI|nr:Bikaverin cluster transcription factor bik5 [Colletotrichum higginsianum]